LRVITGIAKGRRLKAPRGLETRPTTDRTKESLFNIIGNRINGIMFLDLYAGTGAIGIEALSRGAGLAVFVENNPRALKVIRENLALTGLTGHARVLSQDAERAIETLAAEGSKFDIVFMDPPYLKGLVKTGLKKIDECRIVASGGLVIAESGKLDVLPESTGRLQLIRREKYGDSDLSFYQET